jgi:hypothetical protein
LCRINANAAFAAPIRDSGDSAFPGHPRRESLHFVHAYVHGITNSTFCGTAYGGVLAPVSSKYLDAPVVHFDGKRNLEGALWFCEDLEYAGLKIEDSSCLAKPR